MIKNSFKSILIVLISVFIFSCNSEPQEKENKIVTTTNIIGNSIKEIVGTDVPVITLMNSEIDPHSYDASPNDYKEISSAKVVISNGLHLEGRMHQALVNSKNSGTNLIFMSDGLTKDKLIFEDNDVADPHIWFDVQNWYACVSHATTKLCDTYPEHKDTWTKRLDSLKTVYTELDKNVQNKLNTIPDSSRYLVTAHDAFSYYSKAYGITVKPLQGRNTNDEPSTKDIIELSNFIYSSGIKAIFVESTVNHSFIKSIIESVKDKGGNVNEGGELFADATGPEGTPESSYSGMILHNTNTIVNALK